MTATDWTLLAGMRCTCPPRCTVGDTWGDGPRDCSPDCEPCRLMSGKPYTPPVAHSAQRHEVICQQCCRAFIAVNAQARFCSPRCRQRHHRGWKPGRCHEREDAARLTPDGAPNDHLELTTEGGHPGA